jgi:hypothetical protein
MRATFMISKCLIVKRIFVAKSYMEFSCRQAAIAVSQGLDRHDNKNERD